VTHWLVVGGGTAGCVLAARLGEDAANHVTLVEAGPATAGTVALSYLDDLAAPQLLWPGLVVRDGHDNPRPYPQGRGLGGSGLVNGTVLSGGDLPQYDEWGWSGLVAARSRLQVPSEPVAIEHLGPIDRALLGSARDGERAVLSRRAGRRVTTADAYLLAGPRRSNVDVVASTHVARITTDHGRATGIVTIGGDRILADRIVCAAGAIHSPALLLRSGITTLGIGASLTDHPSRSIELSVRPEARSDPHSLVTGAALRRGRVEIVALNHLGAQRPGAAAMLVGLLRTARRGSVRLDPDRPDDPLAPPVVDFGRLDDPDDRRWLDDGVDLATRILAAPGFDDILEGFDVGEGFGGYAHATSTCRMGAVVDAHGAVIGYEHLYVGDASVFPEIPASGTYLPTVLLAERLAALWRAAG
jgi:choline dehydrogenase-like flavoprotein